MRTVTGDKTSDRQIVDVTVSEVNEHRRSAPVIDRGSLAEEGGDKIFYLPAGSGRVQTRRRALSKGAARSRAVCASYAREEEKERKKEAPTARGRHLPQLHDDMSRVRVERGGKKHRESGASA